MAMLIFVYFRLNITLLSSGLLLQKLCGLENVKNVKTGNMMREGWFLRMFSELDLVFRVVISANTSWGRYKIEPPRKMAFLTAIFSVSTN